MGKQFAWETSQGDDAQGRVLGSAKKGTGEAVSDTEVHLEAGPQETGGETGAQGLSGECASTKYLNK